MCREYTIEATIQNKKRQDKFDVYTATETLGNRERKTYVVAAREPAKREEQEEKQTYK